MSLSPKVDGCTDKEREINLDDGLHLTQGRSSLSSRPLPPVGSLQEWFPSKLLAFPGLGCLPDPYPLRWPFLSQIALRREHYFPVSPDVLLGSRWLQELCLKPVLLPQGSEIGQGDDDDMDTCVFEIRREEATLGWGIGDDFRTKVACDLSFLELWLKSHRP